MDVEQVFVVTVFPVELFLEFAANGDYEQYAQQWLHHDLDVRAEPEIYKHRWLYHGRTPLHLAAMHGHHRIIKLILTAPGISAKVVNARDRFGYTPLHLAARAQHWGSVRLLLTASELVFPDRLVAATCNGPHDLDQCGPDYNCKDEKNYEYEGYTPLHVAAFNGNSRIVQLLLSRTCQGATGFDSIRATTWRGKTPLDIAQEKGFTQLVELLESYDVTWMQSERERVANSVNAILVGSALVVAVTFNCWQQPLLGIPDPASVYSHAEGENRTKLTAMFSISVSFAFAFSVAALVVGTLAIMPSTGVALKTEVNRLRSSVRLASSFLIVAILCLMVAFHIGGSLVYKVVAFAKLGWFSSVANQVVHMTPMGFLVYIFWLVFARKGLYGWMTLFAVLVFTITVTTIHFLEYFGHFKLW